MQPWVQNGLWLFAMTMIVSFSKPLARLAIGSHGGYWQRSFAGLALVMAWSYFICLAENIWKALS